MFKISIIIPCHNVGAYVSHINDIYKKAPINEIQFIIVDDGSKDDTWLKLNNFFNEKENVILIRNYDASGSPGCARNIGLWRAEGIYVGFLDADDSLDSDVLREMVQFAIDHDLDVCSAKSFTRVESESIRKNIDLNVIDFEFGNIALKKENLKNSYFSNIWNRIYKKDFLRKEKIFFPDFYITEDFCFSAVSLIKSKKFGVFNRNLYFYTYDRVGSTTRARVGEKGLCILNDLKKLINFFEMHDVLENFKKELTERINGSIAYTFNRLEDEYKMIFLKMHVDLSADLIEKNIILKKLN